MLIEFLVDVFSAQTLGTLSTFNLNFDILNFKLYFALEGFTVIFCFLTALLTFICVLLIWDKQYFLSKLYVCSNTVICYCSIYCKNIFSFMYF